MTSLSTLERRQEHRLQRLSADTAAALARRKGEPTWMVARRLEAWRLFQEMPMPTSKDEDWHRTDISHLRLEELAPFAPAGYQAETFSQLPRRLRPYLRQVRDQAGLLVQHDSEVVYESLDEGLARQGVIFTSLDRALQRHPDLVERYFLTECLQADHNKFVALNGALWSGGVFLYVPAGVSVEMPLHACVWAATPGTALFPHTVVVVDRGATLTYLDELLSAPAPAPDKPVLHAGVVEVYLHEGAQMRYITVQQWGRHVYNLPIQRVVADRDAQLNTLLAALGSKTTKHYLEVVLRGAGAQANLLGLVFGDGDQHFDHQTLQDHQASRTVSNLLFKAAVKEHARTVFSGLAHIQKGTRGTGSYVENRNLVLSDTAKADSIPRLEIETSDVVRCGHGSTVGQVDQEQLFYLMSRGLARRDAEKVILVGFFEPLLRQVPLAEIRQRLTTYIDQRLG